MLCMPPAAPRNDVAHLNQPHDVFGTWSSDDAAVVMIRTVVVLWLLATATMKSTIVHPYNKQ
jgi:hypothetical protein